MTRETRIGLLVGLAFIVMFGLVLGELTNSTESEPLEPAVGIREVSPPDRQRIIVAAHDEPTVQVATATDRTEGRISVSLVRSQDQSGSGGIILAAMQRQAPPARQRSDPPKRETYTVKAGDNGLWPIAEKVYGNGLHWKRIQQANPGVNTNELYVGQQLVIPPLDSSSGRRRSVAPQTVERRALTLQSAQNHREYEEMSLTELRERFSAESNRTRSGGTYVVRAGDNLTRIAEKTLGDGSLEAVGRLYKANRDKLSDPDRLTVGTKLKIPN